MAAVHRDGVDARIGVSCAGRLTRLQPVRAARAGSRTCAGTTRRSCWRGTRRGTRSRSTRTWTGSPSSSTTAGAGRGERERGGAGGGAADIGRGACLRRAGRGKRSPARAVTCTCGHLHVRPSARAAICTCSNLHVRSSALKLECHVRFGARMGRRASRRVWRKAPREARGGGGAYSARCAGGPQPACGGLDG